MVEFALMSAPEMISSSWTTEKLPPLPILLLLHTKRFSDEQKSIAVNLKAKAAIVGGEQEKGRRRAYAAAAAASAQCTVAPD